MRKIRHQTGRGKYYVGQSEEILSSAIGSRLRGKVQLILTSPPFPLNRKKSYGNLTGAKYKSWFKGLASLYSELLADDGSIVVELGNAWVRGRPVQSLLQLESFLAFVNNPDADLRLCQQFICYNPTRLPSPAPWVTRKRIRVTDSYTNVWWMAKTDYPKADNRRVLRPYSDSMRQLLRSRQYNAGKRPSQHNIGSKSFLKKNGGSISHNVLELESIQPGEEVRLPNVMKYSNTSSNDHFHRACREKSIVPHPARMPLELAAYFIEFLTDPGDLVLDPFAGSNTTGFAAETLKRKWVSIEAKEEYVEQSRIRFQELKGGKRKK